MIGRPLRKTGWGLCVLRVLAGESRKEFISRKGAKGAKVGEITEREKL